MSNPFRNFTQIHQQLTRGRGDLHLFAGNLKLEPPSFLLLIGYRIPNSCSLWTLHMGAELGLNAIESVTIYLSVPLYYAYR